MLVPGPPRQAVRIRQRPLACDELLIQRGDVPMAERRLRFSERSFVPLRTPRERVRRVLHRSKIQVRRNLLELRRHFWLSWIVGRLEYSFLQFLVPFADLILLVLQQ